jgi:hypothetical protein
LFFFSSRCSFGDYEEGTSQEEGLAPAAN